MKQCTKCNETKPYEDFHKKSYAKDNCQSKCKVCQNAYTEKYRKEIRPDYWNATDGYFSHKENRYYIGEYRRADKDIIVYLLKIKDFFYCGMTKARLNVRLSIHRADYKSPLNHGKMPGLHNLWDTMSEDEINKSLNSVIILESKAGSRYEGYKTEKKWIQKLKLDWYPLLNDKHNIRQ